MNELTLEESVAKVMGYETKTTDQHGWPIWRDPSRAINRPIAGKSFEDVSPKVRQLTRLVRSRTADELESIPAIKQIYNGERLLTYVGMTRDARAKRCRELRGNTR